MDESRKRILEAALERLTQELHVAQMELDRRLAGPKQFQYEPRMTELKKRIADCQRRIHIIDQELGRDNGRHSPA